MIPLGVLIYAGTGVAGPAARQELPRLLRARPRSGARAGARHLLVEAGVLITVSGTMTAVFYAFVERGR